MLEDICERRYAMHALQVQQIVAKYRRKLHEKGVIPAEYPSGVMCNAPSRGLAHCYIILDEIDTYVREGCMDDALLQLGFVQGCLWMCKVYTITEISEHNQSSSSTS